MSKTQENLMKAFVGESQANRKYLAYAQKADAEGYTQVAKLFRAAAEGETIHALSHLSKTGKIGSTKDNLQDAISGETYEFEDMYPQMISDAKEEGEDSAKVGFEWANAVEKKHASLYKNALESLGENEKVDYYVCSGCGHVEVGKAPEKCPVCGAPASMFKKVD